MLSPFVTGVFAEYSADSTSRTKCSTNGISRVPPPALLPYQTPRLRSAEPTVSIDCRASWEKHFRPSFSLKLARETPSPSQNWTRYSTNGSPLFPNICDGLSFCLLFESSRTDADSCVLRNPDQQNMVWLTQSAALYSSYYCTQILIHRDYISPSTALGAFPSLAICTSVIPPSLFCAESDSMPQECRSIDFSRVGSIARKRSNRESVLLGSYAAHDGRYVLLFPLWRMTLTRASK